MKNIEIMSIVNAYMAQRERNEAARQENKPIEELKLPAAVAWKRRVNLDKIFHAKEIIDDALKEIQNKYSDDKYSIEKEDRRIIREEYVEDYKKAQEDIINQETDVDIKKIKLSDIKDIVLTDNDMDTIAFMIEED